MTSTPHQHRVLFVSAPFGGIEVYFSNLEKCAGESTGMESTWVHLKQSGFPIIGGDLSMVTKVRKLQTHIRHSDAIVCNSVILPRFNLRLFDGKLLILSLDATPVLFDRFRSWYVGKGPDLVDFRAPLRWFFRAQSVLRRADHILAWSEVVRQSLISDYAVADDRITLIPPGVDTGLWQHESPVNVRSEKPVRVLFVGGDFKRKGGDIVLALAQEPLFADVQFDIVTSDAHPGGGPNVHFHLGVEPNTDRLMEIYRGADIFLLPTRADFAPTMALLEALAMGLPALVTRVGGLEEIVLNDRNGFVVDVDDRGAIRKKLRLLIDDPPLRRRLGMAGRTLVEESYDLDRNAKRVFANVLALCKQREKM
jgi:glycosyltransferase involved in cell wall biosynthesis